MAQDSYTEVTSRSWFGRLGSAFRGIVVGLMALVLGVVLLFWNEGRSVKTYRSLQEGAGQVVSVNADTVVSANDGRLVHLSGDLATTEILRDEAFNVAVKALRLRREVEMYQWEERSSSETRKKLGGGEETVTKYTYDKTWSAKPIDASRFKKPDGHENPVDFRVAAATLQAGKVTLGIFTLNQNQVGRIDTFEPLPVAPQVEDLPAPWRAAAKAMPGGFFLGADPQNPRIGDLKVRFQIVRPTAVSLVARQRGKTFEPFATANGGRIDLLKSGRVDAAGMFQQARSENSLLTWILRLVGFLLLFIGLRMILAPLSVAMDVIPMLGNLAGAGLGMVSFLIALLVSLVVIAAAWIFYRPLLAAGLLVVAAGLLFLVWKRKTKGAPPAASPPPPPQPR